MGNDISRTTEEQLVEFYHKDMSDGWLPVRKACFDGGMWTLYLRESKVYAHPGQVTVRISDLEEETTPPEELIA